MSPCGVIRLSDGVEGVSGMVAGEPFPMAHVVSITVTPLLRTVLHRLHRIEVSFNVGLGESSVSDTTIAAASSSSVDDESGVSVAFQRCFRKRISASIEGLAVDST